MLMASFTDNAVVLRRYDYSETSQILVLLTQEHGKIRAIAKGIKRGTKKRFSTAIDILEVGRVAVSAKADRPMELASVTEWTQSIGYSGLRDRLDSLYAGQYCVEITSELTEDWDPHPGLYEAMVRVLAEVSSGLDAIGSAVRYQQALLRAVGSLPQFDNCVGCGRGGESRAFASTQGGVLCDACGVGAREKHPVTKGTLDYLRSGEGSLPPIGPFRLLDYHINHLIGRPTRLAKKLLDAADMSR